MSTPLSPLHKAALEYAAKGWPVFPCLANGKPPAIEGGFKEATTDTDIIDAWWTENPEYNIGLCPDDVGLAVIDEDSAKGADVTPLNLPPTYTVRTPSGGAHYYFAGSVPPTVGKLGEHIDTRGTKSYVLVPPSVVNGNAYHVEQDRDIVALPAEIEARVASRADVGLATVHELDLPGNIITGRTRIRDYVRRGVVAVEGRGGDNLTYKVSCELVRDLGLSVETAFELMTEWNAACSPPWSDDDLRAKLEHAASYGQNEAGTYATAPASEVFKLALDKLQEPSKPGQARGRFLFKTAEQMADTPDPTWTVPELIPEGQIVLFTGSKGNFKSFLGLDVALGIATGKSTFGATPLATGPTFYGAWEGLQLLQKKHRAAWLLERGLDPRDNSIPFYMAPGPMVVDPEQVQNFGDAIQDALDWYHPGEQPRLIVLDTYSKCMMGLDENNPADANRFVRVCQSFIDLWPKCSVLILAHTGKDDSRGTRGSSAFEAGVDSVIDIKRVEKTMLVKATVRHMRAGKERVAPFAMQGREVHDSLVFDYLQPAEAREIAAASNPFDPRRVAHILRRINAVGEGQAVTTAALAVSLTSQEQGERQEAYEARVKQNERTLKVLSRKVLAQLVIPGIQPKWFVPALLEDDAPAEGSVGGASE